MTQNSFFANICLMKFQETEIGGVFIITPKVFEDERGFFMETYKKSLFAEVGINIDFWQDNHTKSSKGVLRGMHYQCNPYPQAKIVRCISGSIYDVALDIRKSSKSFGKWVGTVLNAENKNMLYIPEGFAHGFLSLEDNTEVMYKTSSEYHPERDCGVLWSDPDVNIDWSIGEIKVLSQKDKIQPLLKAIKEENLF